MSRRFSGWAVAIVLVVALFCGCRAPAPVSVPDDAAGFWMPRIFSSHMVLQRGQHIPVWGHAQPRGTVTVKLADRLVRTQVDATGKWRVDLPSMPAGGPYTMTVRTPSTERVFDDVMLGEVWVCSGQSNMAWPMFAVRNAEQEIAAAWRSNIRLFTVPTVTSQIALADVPAHPAGSSVEWFRSTPDNVKHFSAVAWFFGEMLQDELDVPVGLIHTSWGGTVAEAWVSEKALRSEKTLRYMLPRWEEFIANYPAALEVYKKQEAQYQKEVAKAQETGDPIPPRRVWPPPGPDHQNRPASLFNSMIHPLIPFGIRGAIWYQGESNTSRAREYETLFPLLIEDWRRRWQQGDFPFLFVQLANFAGWSQKPQSPESLWGELRQAQRKTLEAVDETGMAVTIDIGESKDIHPRNKQDVGRRLALAALGVAYDRRVPHDGPLHKCSWRMGDRVRVWFENVHGALEIRGDEARGFVVLDGQGDWHPAQAEVVDDNAVDVWSEDVPCPRAVRYGWADDPAVNVYDASGLPLVPFRTDDLEWLSEDARL